MFSDRDIWRLAAISCLAFTSGLAFAGGSAKTSSPAVASPHPLELPISVADVMRASIEIPANGIWAAEAADQLSEEEWRLAD
jgi:hypothetical protein